MAGGLPKTPENFHKIPGARVAILASMWHGECIDSMIRCSTRLLSELEVAADDISVHRLPGSLELPYAAQVLFEQDARLDAVIAFGVVLKGITSHDETVVHTVGERLAQVSAQFSKPVINEVIGVSSIEDAVKRSGDDHLNKGVEAVFALSEVLHWRRSIS